MSMAHADLTREQMAEAMDVTPSTISRWSGDLGTPPKRPYLIQWAAVTGVDLAWIEHGGNDPKPGPGASVRNDQLARLTARKHLRAHGVLPEHIRAAA
jgi:transcriptional regulator with XRE-family HTH domain